MDCSRLRCFFFTVTTLVLFGNPVQAQNWVQRFPTVTPPMQIYYAMAYDSLRFKTVLFGGRPLQSPATDDTWTWDGMNWTKEGTTTSPGIRLQPAMAFDAARGQVVLFGGFGSGTYLADT